MDKGRRRAREGWRVSWRGREEEEVEWTYGMLSL